MPLLASVALLGHIAPNVSVFCYKTYILYLKLFLLSFSRLSPADSPFCWSAVQAEYPSRAITLCVFKLYYSFYIPVRCFPFSEQHVVGDSCVFLICYSPCVLLKELPSLFPILYLFTGLFLFNVDPCICLCWIAYFLFFFSRLFLEFWFFPPE